MDIRRLGYERITALLHAGFIADVADLYDRDKVSVMRLLTLEGFAEKSAQQLIDAIDASKRQPLSTLLFALGIRHIGVQGARLLARHFGTTQRLAKATVDEIKPVRCGGEAIAEAVPRRFPRPRDEARVERLP